MGRNGLKQPSLKGEGGAISVKAILITASLVITAFVLIRVVPVYIEQQEICHDSDELARKAAIGTSAYSKDRIEKEILTMIQNYGLPQGSIQLANLEGNHSDIGVKYTRDIDLWVTSYPWSVDKHFTHSGFD
jgi:hypothetical protein